VPPTEAPPPVADPGDGLSAVLRDEKQGAPTGVIGAAVDVLRSCYDPEIPVNIYDLGLIYQIAESEPGKLFVKMTLTSPMCPVAGSLPPEVKQKMAGVPGVSEARVDVVWDPAWSPEKMSEAARLQLNMF
jgi:FeS assembly SUF system protein